jgi:hypothetical protein
MGNWMIRGSVQMRLEDGSRLRLMNYADASNAVKQDKNPRKLNS